MPYPHQLCAALDAAAIHDRAAMITGKELAGLHERGQTDWARIILTKLDPLTAAIRAVEAYRAMTCPDVAEEFLAFLRDG